jgi:hypothetical protein
VSSRYCGGLVIAAYFLLSAAAASAQIPAQCYPSGWSTVVRAEGLSEKMGDVVLDCYGGTPTPAGLAVPTADFTLVFNGIVTSRLLQGDWSEALLVIDEYTASAQRMCAEPAGTCSITGTGTGTGTFDGSAGRPNVFQGRVIGPNQILFAGIPFDAPGPFGALPYSGTRRLSFTNLRVNASTFPESFTPPMVVASVAVTGPAALVLDPSPVVAAFVLHGMSSVTDTHPMLSACSAQNGALATDPAASGTPQFSITLGEGTTPAFAPRTLTAYVDPNTSPDPVNQTNAPMSESQFVNISFPNVAGRGDLSRAGLADYGTRLAVLFSQIPPGVKLYAPATVALSRLGTPTGIVRMVDSASGPFNPVPANASGLAPIAVSGGTASAVFEVLKSHSTQPEQATIPIYVAYQGGVPAPGSVILKTRFAPLGSGMASASESIPRFVDGGTPQVAFTIQACSCATNVSSQVLVSRSGFRLNRATNRFEQTVSIKNTTAAAIAGPLVLAFDNLSANASVYTPAGVTSCASPASPFLNIIAQGSALAPGQTVTIPAAFLNPTQAAISYATRVLSGSTR